MKHFFICALVLLSGSSVFAIAAVDTYNLEPTLERLGITPRLDADLDGKSCAAEIAVSSCNIYGCAPQQFGAFKAVVASQSAKYIALLVDPSRYATEFEESLFVLDLERDALIPVTNTKEKAIEFLGDDYVIAKRSSKITVFTGDGSGDQSDYELFSLEGGGATSIGTLSKLILSKLPSHKGGVQRIKSLGGGAFLATLTKDSAYPAPEEYEGRSHPRWREPIDFDAVTQVVFLLSADEDGVLQFNPLSSIYDVFSREEGFVFLNTLDQVSVSNGEVHILSRVASKDDGELKKYRVVLGSQTRRDQFQESRPEYYLAKGRSDVWTYYDHMRDLVAVSVDSVVSSRPGPPSVEQVRYQMGERDPLENRRNVLGNLLLSAHSTNNVVGIRGDNILTAEQKAITWTNIRNGRMENIKSDQGTSFYMPSLTGDGAVVTIALPEIQMSEGGIPTEVWVIRTERSP